ncbi:UDP-glucose/GDP-mannose dehydrogenase family protein [Candidatus Woesearchaeota archaeon]|nr:UDP-glucose/GDP-mannose dehydrogenase family protein [Candidatus Woesearchaeota archaeon]
MKITIVGTGYVGLVTGTCLADMGNDVICLDKDKEKLKNLEKGIMPIYERGLRDLIERNIREKRLIFTADTKKAIQNSDIIFICVGTPPQKDGSVNMEYIYSVAKSIGKYINSYKVIVDKSTVPVGTAEKVEKIIKEELKKSNKKIDFDVVSNPEFLREGAAIKDFQNPDRVVVGTKTKDEKSIKIMERLYRSTVRVGRPIIFTDRKSAELIKYASNAMLATRISFINQLSQFCDKIGANIKEVSKGMGLDSRIGTRFLQAGSGFGGSCFPKDVSGLAMTLKENNSPNYIFESVIKANEEQKKYVVKRIEEWLGNLKGKTIAVWGLSFKPRTDDVRESPSLSIVNEFLKKGAKLKLFDPEAKENFKKEFPPSDNISYGETSYDVVENADILVILTEWDEFREPDFKKIKKKMNKARLFDARNIYNPEEIKEEGFEYNGVGRR